MYDAQDARNFYGAAEAPFSAEDGQHSGGSRLVGQDVNSVYPCPFLKRQYNCVGDKQTSSRTNCKIF